MDGDPEWNSGESAYRGGLALSMHGRFGAIVAAAILGSILTGASPPWWTSRGLISTNAPVTTNDYGAINQGQLKHVASKAAEELDARLPGGTGSNIVGMIAAWTNSPGATNDYVAANLGQLKAVAAPFYDRLGELGILTNDYPWTAGLSNGYPWTGGSNANDFAMANLGQLKRVFSFDLSPWNSDDDHLPDQWEQAYFGATNLSQGDSGDPDGDGSTNLQEYQQESDPTNFYNGVLPSLAVVSGDSQTNAAGAFLLDPLVVRVTGGSGWLSNAPVMFLISPTGGLSAAYGSTNVYESLVARSDGQGLASVYAKLPDIAGTNVSVVAMATSGTGSVSVAFSATVQAPGPSMVAAGGASSMAVTWSGQLMAWGANRFGQLGDGSTTNRLAPIPAALSNVVSVSTGPLHSLAVLSDGTVWSWGCNRHGELGVGNRLDSWTPAAVSGLTGAIAVAVGGEHSVVVDGAGQVWAWGANWSAQLGTNSPGDRLAPEPVLAVSGAVTVAVGRAHTMALAAGGLVYGWGDNRFGQLGVDGGGFLSIPTVITGMNDIVAISAGQAHSVALSSNGTVFTWGANWAGQLGDGSREDRYVPTVVSGLVDIVAIAAGGDHTIAVSSNGTCYGFGANWRGQLTGTNAWFKAVPEAFSEISGATDAEAGFDHTLILESDGAVFGVGANTAGQVGDGSGVDRSEPVEIGDL